MRKKLASLLAVALVAGGVSCAVNDKVALSPSGEKIRLALKDSASLGGEFLFCDEHAVYLGTAASGEDRMRVTRAPFTEIRKLNVEGIKNSAWPGYVIGFQIVPAVVLGGVCAATNNSAGTSALVAGAFSIPGILSALLFSSSSGPGPLTLEGEITLEKLKTIQKYARFPFTPDAEQARKILESLK